METGKTGKYLKYAIGEIILVMIGILLALQVNNWNENKKTQKEVKQIRINLLNELHQDLEGLNRIDSITKVRLKTIDDYTNYYNNPQKIIDSIIIYMDNLNLRKASFETRTFTLEEIITSGDIKLFSDVEKNAMRILKQTHNSVKKSEAVNLDYTIDFEFKGAQGRDGLRDRGLINTEHRSVRDWRRNLDSKQYLHLHNTISAHLFIFNYIINSNARIRTLTKDLIEVLEDNT